jgi:hypothetical protein
MGFEVYIDMAGGTSDNAVHGPGEAVALNMQGEDFSARRLLLDAAKAAAS